MLNVLGALTLLAAAFTPVPAAAPAETAVVPDKCYVIFVRLDPSCSPNGICEMEVTEVPCPD